MVPEGIRTHGVETHRDFAENFCITTVKNEENMYSRLS